MLGSVSEIGSGRALRPVVAAVRRDAATDVEDLDDQRAGLIITSSPTSSHGTL
jgi:hypothetical protein